jgi:hypothetical protein
VAGLLEDLATDGCLRVLTRLDPTGGDFPSPLVGDEAVAPDEEDVVAGVVEDDGGLGCLGMVRTWWSTWVPSGSSTWSR